MAKHVIKGYFKTPTGYVIYSPRAQPLVLFYYSCWREYEQGKILLIFHMVGWWELWGGEGGGRGHAKKMNFEGVCPKKKLRKRGFGQNSEIKMWNKIFSN